MQNTQYFLHLFLIHSRMFTVPIILLSRYSIGCSIDGTISDKAARCTTQETFLKYGEIISLLLISALINLTLGFL